MKRPLYSAFRLLLCSSIAGVTVQPSLVRAVPISEARLLAADIIELAQRKPFWCVERSGDGRSCRNVLIVEASSGVGLSMNRLALVVNRSERVGLSERFEMYFEGDALCITRGSLVAAQRVWRRASGDEIGALATNIYQVAAEADELERAYASAMSEIGKMNGDAPDTRMCLTMTRVGSDDEHIATIMDWLPTNMDAVPSRREHHSFAALPSDPGLSLRAE